MSMSSIKEVLVGAWSSVTEKKLLVIDKFVVGKVMVGHLVKSYKVREAFSHPLKG